MSTKDYEKRLSALETMRPPTDGDGIPFDAMPVHLQRAVTAACTDGRLDVSLLSDEALRELLEIGDAMTHSQPSG